MDVQLYVYDLSRGMARQMSKQFLGTQIDAVYHTSLVFGGIEYFFGQGIQTCRAGATHHGQPMEVVPLGQTSLPIEVILEYLESLRAVYTPESYDLFAHNCNNFTNDFAMFLVGKNIPEHISSLPKTVLQTPFGQMLRPYLDQTMRPITQAPLSNGSSGMMNAHRTSSPVFRPSEFTKPGEVHNVTSLSALNKLLDEARSSCAVIFFTSATCPPCKLVYPTYDELAAEAGKKATLIKVDINSAHEIGSRYSIRATPTFITFLKGQKQEQWSGASPPQLRGNVQMLLQAAFPAHAHQHLRLPHFHRSSRQPVLYTKVPPLDKVVARMGTPYNGDASIQAAVKFIQARNSPDKPSQEAPLPDLRALGTHLREALTALPPETLFTAYDLLRLILVDARASGFFAEEASQSTIVTLLSHVNSLDDACPYNLRLVALHLSANLFSTPLLASSTLPSSPALAELLVALVANSLLDTDHANIRVAASSVAFNLAAAEHLSRIDTEGFTILGASERRHAVLPDDKQVELAASILETLAREASSPETIRGLALALGRLLYGAIPAQGEVADLCRAMDADTILMQKASLKGVGLAKDDVDLLKEVKSLLAVQE